MYWLHLAGRALGVLSAALLCLVWLYAIWFPSGGLTITGLSVLVAGFMTLLAIVAGIASAKGHGPVVFGVFVVSFLPIGAYLLGVDHWLRWIGILDTLLLVAAAVIWVGKGAKRRPL
jgi:hypothetical protein